VTSVEHDRLTTAESVTDDRAFDRAIRPKTLADYHGQPNVSQQMGVFIEAARRPIGKSSVRCCEDCYTKRITTLSLISRNF